MERFMRSFAEEFEEIREFCESDNFRREVERTKTLLSSRPLILYGAGVVGVSYANMIKARGVKPSCFCDKNKKDIEKQTGLPIISPKSLKEQFLNANIFVSSIDYESEIINDLEMLGINPSHIFTRNNLFFSELTLSDLLPHLMGYERAYNLFVDGSSRKVMINRLKHCLMAMPMPYSLNDNLYFDPEIISLSEAEVFIDGGMWIGDTAEIFFSKVTNYKDYYGFEPNEQNFRAACEALSSKPNVSLIQKGLYNCETQINFSTGFAASSRIDETGSESIETTSIDDFLHAKPHMPTLIKMDIEGAEAKALEGAKNTIIKHKPRLAICAYHKADDLYVLPELIKSFRDDYVFYLRHYSGTVLDTVIYAV